VRYLSIEEVVELHRRIILQSGGGVGLRDRGALDAAVSQPFQTFGGEDLYEGVIAKAAALGFFLASNHPFVDGNKRIAHAALEVTLILNGYELDAPVEAQESVMLRLASGEFTREQFTLWVRAHSRIGA